MIAVDRFSMSCFIGQSLANDASKRDFRALHIIDAELGAGVHAEVELREIPIQMLLIHVLIYANKTALEDRKEPFQGIGMYIAARPLALGMIDRFVLRRRRHDESESVRAVSDQAAIFVQMLVHSTADVPVIQVHGADIAAAFYQREYHRRGFGIQCGASGFAGLGRLAQIGFVGFDGLAEPTDHIAVALHGLADAMAQEPRSLHAAIEHPLNLPGADAFLAGAHQVDDLQPQMQRQMAGFENGAHADSERLLAAIALAKARTGGLAIQAAHTITAAAMRAYRALWPEMCFNIREGGGFVFELGGEKDQGGHGGISYGQNSSLGA
jgi:hypothetical protein